MLKIQELHVDDEVYRLREPRLADYVRARKLDSDEFVFSMLAGMVLDEQGVPIGDAGVMELPLRVLEAMSKVVGDFVVPRAAPLTTASDSSTG